MPAARSRQLVDYCLNGTWLTRAECWRNPVMKVPVVVITWLLMIPLVAPNAVVRTMTNSIHTPNGGRPIAMDGSSRETGCVKVANAKKIHVTLVRHKI